MTTTISPDVINDKIIEYLSLGLTAKEIAAIVGLKTRGMEKRIATLRKRYDARSVTHLVCAYLEHKTKSPL